jgi:hypothetical protein
MSIVFTLATFWFRQNDDALWPLLKHFAAVTLTQKSVVQKTQRNNITHRTNNFDINDTVTPLLSLVHQIGDGFARLRRRFDGVFINSILTSPGLIVCRLLLCSWWTRHVAFCQGLTLENRYLCI